MAVSESKQGGTLKLVNPKHKDGVSIQLLTLSILAFLFILPRYQVVLQWKQTKEKLGNALKCVKEERVELHEIKRNRYKTEIGKLIIW